MHKGAAGHSREEIVRQIIDGEKSIYDYESYIPIGNASTKLYEISHKGGEIIYLSSRRKENEINTIRNVLKKYDFPIGKLEYRKDDESYADVAERIMPDILIEDDCESIGGKPEMTYPNISANKKQKIKSIVVKEFSGIDNIEISEINNAK